MTGFVVQGHKSDDHAVRSSGKGFLHVWKDSI